MPRAVWPARASSLCLCQCRHSSSKYTPKLNIRARYIPGTTAPLQIPDLEVIGPDELPGPRNLIPGPSKHPRTLSADERRAATWPALPADSSNPALLPSSASNAVSTIAEDDEPRTRLQRTRAVRKPIAEAYKKVGSVPLVPLPHKDFVPSYLKEKQRWQRAIGVFNFWSCLLVAIYGSLFYEFTTGDRETALSSIRRWFGPKWDRFWTLTPYDRAVLGLPLDDTAERLELQTVREMAYRAPRESDVYWQTSQIAQGLRGSSAPAGDSGPQRDFGRTMPPKPF